MGDFKMGGGLGSLRDREDGISLVEMLVAIFVLGLVLAGLAQALIGSLVAVQRQEEQVKATALANEQLENVRQMEWRDVALCNADALATFGGASYSGRTLALVSDSDARCTASPTRVVAASTSGLTRDGVAFDVQRAVTWFDDLGDGSGAADLSGQDIKWVEVEVSWTSRGDTRTVVSETKLAPAIGQQDLTTAVVPDASIGSGEVVYLEAATDQNRNAFRLQAETVHDYDSVIAQWVDRDGSTESRTLTTSDGGFTWSYDVPDNVGPFLNGETLFVFTGTRTVGGSSETAEVVDRGLFLHDLAIDTVTVPGTISVDLVQRRVCDFQVDADLTGVLLSDDIVATWSEGFQEEAMLAGASTATGATFTLPYGGDVGTWSLPSAPSVDDDDLWPVPVGSLDLTVTANRIVDFETATTAVTDIRVEGVRTCGP